MQAGVEVEFELLAGRLECPGRVAIDLLGRGMNSLKATCEAGLFVRPTVVRPIALRDFTEVARSGRRDDEHLLTCALVSGKRRMQRGSRLFCQGVHHASL